MTTTSSPPFLDLVTELGRRYPRYFHAGGCGERASAACDALLAAGYEARISERLPAEAFGYQPREVWLYGDGHHSLDRPDRPCGLRVTRASGHFVCLVTWDNLTWLVDLAAGQFGIEEHPVLRPLTHQPRWSAPLLVRAALKCLIPQS